MINLIPTATDELALAAKDLIINSQSGASLCAQSILLTDNTCTAGRSLINFCATPNPLARFFFATSVVCGVAGATSAGVALTSSVFGMPTTAVVGAFGARSFNRLGRYTLHIGNLTNGNLINVTNVGEFMQ